MRRRGTADASLPRDALRSAVRGFDAAERESSIAWRFPLGAHAPRRSMISETNIMIGFDTLSESDTRGEERAYRLAQRGSKELVKHELFPAERRKNTFPPPSFVPADPECSANDSNRSQRSRSSHFFLTPLTPLTPPPPLSSSSTSPSLAPSLFAFVRVSFTLRPVDEEGGSEERGERRRFCLGSSSSDF
ncbi:unnamed protein product [Pleuronectes platessa]|uniref:Uncharacterized protein n=1 Tax=Pleuronectes platessa TaxID=8262 RepID=A0A9N7YHQ8_PLEPL|nr:unnamed protein product [Pleuronectes platessa]